MKPYYIWVCAFAFFFVTVQICSQGNYPSHSEYVADEIYSRNSNVFENKQDSIPENYDKKFWGSEKKKKNSMFFSAATGYASLLPDDKLNDFGVHEALIGMSKSDNALFLSLKTGYQTSSPEYDKGLGGNWMVDISAGALFKNKWKAGIGFRFWNSTIEDYALPISGALYDKEFKGSLMLLFGQYKFDLSKKAIASYLGIGLGNYNIAAKSVDGYFQSRQFMCLGFQVGLVIPVASFITIDIESSFNRLLGFKENTGNHNFFEFKIGPSLFLFY